MGFSKNDFFDAIIKYEKSRTIELVSLANDCDEFELKRIFQFLYTLIQQNILLFKPYSIRLG